MQEDDRRVSVVLALPQSCQRTTLMLAPGQTVADAVTASGLAAECERLTGYAPAAYGIYGRKVRGEHRPADGDRIELLRALEIDPRERRRGRAERG